MCSGTSAKAAKIGYLIVSGFLCLMGLWILLRPNAPLRTLVFVCGVTLLLFGAVRLIGYFSKDLFQLAFENDLVSGILMLVLGCSLLLYREYPLPFFCTVLGILILMDGLGKVQIAAEAKPFGIPQWRLLLGAGLATALLGCTLIFRPSIPMKQLERLLGICLILDGVLNIITMLTSVSARSTKYMDKEAR